MLKHLTFTLLLLLLAGPAQEAGREKEKPPPIPPVGAYPGLPDPDYQDHRFSSFHLPMADGVSLAVDLVLPGSGDLAERIPALVEVTRRWRSLAEKEFPADRLLFVHRGYAFLRVDARGTGASFGVRLGPGGERARRDGAELLRWLGEQEWCDGRVGVLGFYDDAWEAECLARAGKGRVKALALVYGEHDLYTDLLFPGGVRATGGVKAWSALTAALDRGRWPFPSDGSPHTVRPVDGDVALSRLADALAAHKENRTLFRLGRGRVFRDDLDPLPGAGPEGSGAPPLPPLLLWGGWEDGAVAAGILRRFAAAAGPVRALIEAGCRRGPDFRRRPEWGREEEDPLARPRWRELLRFFDIHLRETVPGEEPRRALLYQAGPGGSWVADRRWPPAGMTLRSYHLTAGGNLAALPPARAGKVSRKGDFTATTGPLSRWWARTFTRRVEPARRGDHLFTFTSPPLPQEALLAGTPLLRLHCASTARDGALFAYLEAVDPAGAVVLLTEGMLRLACTAAGTGEGGFGRRHPFTRAARVPLRPGRERSILVPLLPLARRLAKGTRLRLGLECHDEDNFARLPARGVPEITLFFGEKGESRLEVPLGERKGR